MHVAPMIAGAHTGSLAPRHSCTPIRSAAPKSVKGADKTTLGHPAKSAAAQKSNISSRETLPGLAFRSAAMHAPTTPAAMTASRLGNQNLPQA